MTRRSFAAAFSAVPMALQAEPRKSKWSICSETFAGKPFEEACASARTTGYSGLEIDPSNLSEDPAGLSASERAAVRRAMAKQGLAFVGLHSFLKAPNGLHLTSGGAALRERSWQYFERLIHLAADLGNRPLMILGSSKQRHALEGTLVPLAVDRLREGLARVSPAAEKRGVTILLEPLAPHLCNVVNTLDEAVAIRNAIGSAAIRTMLDTHNTAAETMPLPQLIEKHFSQIRHVHLNEMDGKYPGSGDFAFAPVLNKLRNLNYAGWLSVEVFDFHPDGETVARKAADYLKKL